MQIYKIRTKDNKTELNFAFLCKVKIKNPVIMKKTLVLLAAIMLFSSCLGPSQKKISKELTESETVKIKPVVVDDFIYLTGAELHQCVSDAVEDLKEAEISELTTKEKESMELFDKTTYNDCKKYIEYAIKNGQNEADMKYPKMKRLNDGADIIEFANDYVVPRKEINRCMKKWDPCVFERYSEFAYYDTIVKSDDYCKKTLADKRIRDFNGYIETRMSEFSKEDLAAVVKKEAIASSLFPEITESNADSFAKDVAEYAASSDIGLPMYQWASVQHRKILYKVMSIVSVKNYGGDIHTMEALLDW